MIGKEMSCYFTLKVNKFDDNLLQKFRLQILQPPPPAQRFLFTVNTKITRRASRLP